MFDRIQKTYREYPSKYWILVAATFIDRVGGTLVFPFFTLYITQKFDVGMTQAGLVFGVFAVASFIGNLLGGGLTDRFGRRRIVIGGLVLSALSSVALGLADSLALLVPLAAGVGLLSDMAGPARAAMVADMLPDSQRAEGFGVMRVAGNLAWLVGPTLGGLVATRSYLGLFIGDAITSLITAVIIFRSIPETMPAEVEVDQHEPLRSTFGGYLRVLADRPYLAFLLISIVMNLVYLQLYTTLSVYLRDVHGIAPRGYGALMSINAGLVVVAQFWVTRRTRSRPPMLVMAMGSALYLVGFTLFGVVASYPLFIVAMLIVTCGEMLVIPVSQAVVALLAPVEMRGRYMGVFSLSWGIPSAIGPWAAGLILDNLNPDLVWYIAGLLSAAAIAGFVWLQSQAGERLAASESAVPSTASAG
ncbi:MAG: MFS transporter [Anaerolineales bacterium]